MSAPPVDDPCEPEALHPDLARASVWLERLRLAVVARSAGRYACDEAILCDASDEETGLVVMVRRHADDPADGVPILYPLRLVAGEDLGRVADGLHSAACAVLEIVDH